jgi:alpha-galactosidase
LRPRPGILRRGAAIALATALLATTGLAFADTAGATVLAPTPYMGWDTYFAFGPRFSESTVLEQASTLLQSGLARDGYRYVWLDVGWWQGNRSHGRIVVSHTQWPHGIRWLAETLHAAGLKLGLYTDAGRQGCGGKTQGSYGHYQQDVNTFASWGIDAVKVDFCGGVRMKLNPRSAYTSFHDAILHDSPHRPMLLSICDFLEPGQYKGEPAFEGSAFSIYAFGPQVGNSWRTDTDVGSPDHVLFGTVLRNLDADATHPEAAGPGHWNDPDYLGPDQGMDGAQFRTQLSMWAIVAAPLMVSENLANMSSETLEALTNREVIAIDQDPAGIQGTLHSSKGNAQVWAKPLSDGSRAVALLNRGSTPLTISTSAQAVGMAPAASYSLRNLWTHSTSASASAISAQVPGESTVLLRVYPG